MQAVEQDIRQTMSSPPQPRAAAPRKPAQPTGQPSAMQSPLIGSEAASFRATLAAMAPACSVVQIFSRSAPARPLLLLRLGDYVLFRTSVVASAPVPRGLPLHYRYCANWLVVTHPQNS